MGTFTCNSCNRTKSHEARGLCLACYKKLQTSKGFVPYPRSSRENYHSKDWVCPKCNVQRPHFAKELCIKCYKNKWAKDHKPNRPREIDFSNLERWQIESYLLSLPSWRCKECKIIIHPDMKVEYQLARDAWPLCIPCHERESEIEYRDTREFVEFGKAAKSLQLKTNGV